MSKSLKRVCRALADAGRGIVPREMAESNRTAADAAAASGCSLDQIATSIVFHRVETDRVALSITAGGNQVDTDHASAVAGAPLDRANADQIRAQTGFAIGGVSPPGLAVPAGRGSILACCISPKSASPPAHRAMFSRSIREILSGRPAHKYMILIQKCKLCK